jgi:hypothetical protein
MSYIENLKINYAKLGYEDHGIFTFTIGLEGDGYGIGFGQYALDDYDGKERVGTQKGCQMIMDLLKVVGVNNWEDLEGTYIRAEFENRNKITRIGNLIKNQWFCVQDYFKEN